MDWASLLRSVVLAAVISGIVATVGFWVSSATALKINKDKLKLDKELAEQKAAAELALAERRVELDRHLALAKRKAEVAEGVLAAFHRIQRAFEIIRSPMIWAAEMIPEEGVSEDVTRNDGYGVIRRIRQYADQFSELEATRFTFGALFGQEATRPYDLVTAAHNRVVNAAQELLRIRNEPHLPQMDGFKREMRRTAFSMTDVDEKGQVVQNKLTAEIAAAVQQMEATCRPILESTLAAEAAGRSL